MFHRPAFIFVVLAVAGGCKHDVVKRACMGGSDASTLVTGAALTRLDVYGAVAHCGDAGIADNSGAPVLSRTFTAGQPVTLDVPPGHHAVVLTTFADDAGTQPLGVACTEDDFTAGAQLCFDLTLAPAPDGGVAVGCSVDVDCGDTPGAACCSGRCTNTRTDPLNCNGCGMACTGGNTQCCNGQCSNPQTDIDNCGACGNVCTLADATPMCTASGCAVASCNAGHDDCDKDASNGCECGTSCCVNPTTNAPGCMTVHTNGHGGTYSDCYPLGTPGTASTAGTGYNANMAQDAAMSDMNQVGTSYTSLSCGNNASTITSLCRYMGSNSKQGPCTCWAYSCGTTTTPGNAAACAVIGHVFANPANNGCLCVLVTDPTWN